MLPEPDLVRHLPFLAALVLLAILVIPLSLRWDNPLVLISQGRSLPLPVDHSADSLLIDWVAHSGSDAMPLAGDDFNPVSLEPLALREYVVQPGDSLSVIANRYGLNMDTIISFNEITDPRRIRVGQKYQIPNRDGLKYRTRKGDTIEKIAKSFDVSVTAILDGNSMETEAIESGKDIFVPGARLNPTDLKLLLGELFAWPVKGYRLSSGYGYRVDPFTGARRFHNGIDICAFQGAPIRAAQAGRVIMVENQVGNYGKVVIIQHDRGFRTLYGHMDSFAVQIGQYVSQGQLIGRMGNTGRSTGTHLHFTVLRNGVTVNPRKYLP